MDTKFQNWLIEHDPDDKMLYKESFWKAYIFWRDYIIPMYAYEPKRDCPDDYVARIKISDYDKVTEIVGTHWSKSIEHPVVKLTYKGVEIVFRYNFYDYEVAVISPVKLHIPMEGLFRSKRESFYYQGFPDKYKLTDRYEDNQFQFMASVSNHYKFYTFMYLLKNAIDEIF